LNELAWGEGGVGWGATVKEALCVSYPAEGERGRGSDPAGWRKALLKKSETLIASWNLRGDVFSTISKTIQRTGK